ncbi:hypothetical protein OBBRIDRAFT_388302 [Obba rivulosa]|uniref:Uncharacterized protein n=1 Tax=Obba rivulosa TaxID=1052685 RepID=A0A8E2B373_9APHY|nr:hypothetical protein OBBRIDRAFT_388302 [Obba rivulosa]
MDSATPSQSIIAQRTMCANLSIQTCGPDFACPQAKYRVQRPIVVPTAPELHSLSFPRVIIPCSFNLNEKKPTAYQFIPLITLSVFWRHIRLANGQPASYDWRPWSLRTYRLDVNRCRRCTVFRMKLVEYPVDSHPTTLRVFDLNQSDIRYR